MMRGGVFWLIRRFLMETIPGMMWKYLMEIDFELNGNEFGEIGHNKTVTLGVSRLS